MSPLSAYVVVLAAACGLARGAVFSPVVTVGQSVAAHSVEHGLASQVVPAAPLVAAPAAPLVAAPVIRAPTVARFVAPAPLPARIAAPYFAAPAFYAF